jgi:CTP:molybdopterin cytidylyltransferase MocA
VTVAAIVLVPDPVAALADADGEPVLRRIARAAWSGGAMPAVAVMPAAPPELAAALADLPLIVIVAPVGTGPGMAWFALGLREAALAVTETTAGLMWPFRHAWVDPETVTSLVEAHGADPAAICRPAWEGTPGFPVLVPAALGPRLASMTGVHGGDAIDRLVAEGVALRLVELGDPGITHDIGSPRSELPPYQGPTGPAGGPPPDWNADLGAQAQVAGEAEGGA